MSSLIVHLLDLHHSWGSLDDPGADRRSPTDHRRREKLLILLMRCLFLIHQQHRVFNYCMNELNSLLKLYELLCSCILHVVNIYTVAFFLCKCKGHCPTHDAPIKLHILEFF